MPAERRSGMDHEHYAWSPLVKREPLRWPGGAHVALSVIVNLEHVELEPPEGSEQSQQLAGGLGVRPYPNYPLLSHREYGHRVGIFRILDVLERHGIRPTIALDAMTAEHYPWLVEHCLGRGAEIVAHGISVSRLITSRMSQDEERTYIAESLERLHTATGVQPQGWLGPEHSESERTPQLLAEAGLRYVCDWVNDEQPYAMTVATGSLVALPVMLEYDDAFALWTRGVMLDTYRSMLCDGFDQLLRDGAESGRLLALNLRPWLIGQPFRIKVLDDALAHMVRERHVWTAATGEIVDRFVAAAAA